MTNADRIRKMTSAELLAFLKNYGVCVRAHETGKCTGFCDVCRALWLTEKVAEERP